MAALNILNHWKPVGSREWSNLAMLIWALFSIYGNVDESGIRIGQKVAPQFSNLPVSPISAGVTPIQMSRLMTHMAWCDVPSTTDNCSSKLVAQYFCIYIINPPPPLPPTRVLFSTIRINTIRVSNIAYVWCPKFYVYKETTSIAARTL